LSESVYSILTNLADRQTDKQMKQAQVKT